MRDRDVYDPLRDTHEREKVRGQEAEREREEREAREAWALQDAAENANRFANQSRDADIQAHAAQPVESRQGSEPSHDDLSPTRPEPPDNRLADYERGQREARAREEREERRDAFMEEHHPEEHAAEQERRRQREQNLRAGPVDDGVYRQDETQRQVLLQQDDAARESAEQRHDPQTARDSETHEAGPAREATEREVERTARTREQGDAAQRRSALDWFLAKREIERAQERDGGDRGR